MRSISFLIMIGVFAALAAPDALAASRSGVTATEEQAPLKVTSKEMVTDKKNSRIIFSGDVVATKGELMIKTDEMTVWTDENQREFKKIVARGSVRISREDKVATGEEAEYFNENKKTGQEERIEISGNAYLKDGLNSASGKKVIYFFKTADMKISGDTSTPSVITLFPDGAQKPPAADQPPPDLDKPVQDRVESKPPPPPVEKPVIIEKRRGIYYEVQVASFQHKSDARQLAAKLNQKGFKAHIEEAKIKSGLWYRVKEGGYETLEEAEQAVRRMQSEFHLKPLIIQKSD